MITDETPVSCVIICQCGYRVVASGSDTALTLMVRHELQGDGACGNSARDSLRRRKRRHRQREMAGVPR